MGGKLTSPGVTAVSPERTFIVTGANSGIGYNVAKVLAQHGGRVIVACRSEERALKAIEQMKKEHQEENENQHASKKPDAAGDAANKAEDDDTTKKPDEEVANVDETPDKTQTLNLEFMKLDLGSLASTMEFINAYKAKGYPLHTLVCNAGLQVEKQEFTSDDIELLFQVNYLGHHLLILHLLPLIQQSGPNGRVVCTSYPALTFKMGTKVVLDDLQGRNKYVGALTMGTNTKLYQMQSLYSFERRVKGPHVGWFAVNPGFLISTPGGDRFLADKPVSKYSFKAMLAVGLAKTARQGADVLLKAILDPAYDDKPVLYFDSKCGENGDNPGSLARDVEKQEAIWKYSLECLKDYITDDIMKGLNEPPSREEAKDGEQSKEGEQDKEGGAIQGEQAAAAAP